MATNISRSPAETAALGETWGRTVQRGLVIGLCGDLGAGKTQLVKGLARGLGIEALVHSPTFALVNVYPGGRLPLFHLDLYRLDTPDQIRAAGLEEYLQPDGVAVIEWAERWYGTRPPSPDQKRSESSTQKACVASPWQAPIRWVQIEMVSESERRITYEDIGA
jgi:tRNA threonylcarbamoyladenosine biosynthesis protein TsaE